MNITTSPHLDASKKSQIDRNVNIPSSQHIILLSEMELQSFRKEVKSVLIETSSDVFVISHDDAYGTVGSTTHIPLHKLSTRYVVISAKPEATRTSQVAVSAIEDNSTISITFKMKGNVPLIIDGKTFHSGDMFNLSLNRFETFIESSVPIAAFSGNDCVYLGGSGACDHLIEQLPPIASVDKTYLVPPNSDERDTIIRITAIENSNMTYKIGSVSQTLTLMKFIFFNTRISSSQTCIESDVPLLVTTFGLKSRSSTLGDPSMTIIPGLNQYLDYYKIVVPSGYDHNYVSIMMKHFSKDSLRINSTVINAGDVVFEENVSYGNLTYNVRSIRVVEGELTASTTTGSKKY